MTKQWRSLKSQVKSKSAKIEKLKLETTKLKTNNHERKPTPISMET